ncbi:MAG: DUF493 domain-containing protein [Verrucomicrobiota bacterium]
MQDYSAFEAKLNDDHDWPCTYTFKCIVPSAEADTFRSALSEHTLTDRASKSGKYISFTLEFTAQSSNDVVAVYQTASTIPGAMPL